MWLNSLQTVSLASVLHFYFIADPSSQNSFESHHYGGFLLLSFSTISKITKWQIICWRYACYGALVFLTNVFNIPLYYSGSIVTSIVVFEQFFLNLKKRLTSAWCWTSIVMSRWTRYFPMGTLNFGLQTTSIGSQVIIKGIQEMRIWYQIDKSFCFWSDVKVRKTKAIARFMIEFFV